MISDLFTLVIQGPVNKNMLTMIGLQYEIATIVSTWDDPKWTHPTVKEYVEQVNRSNLKIIVNPMPKQAKMDKVYNSQNRYYQFLSTFKGLQWVQTPYVIKVRSDEYYTDLTPIMRLLLENDDKLVTNDVFFRKIEYLRYHVSDHIMCAKTHRMHQMFKEMLYDCEFNKNQLKFAPFSQHDFWLFVEQQIGMKYIELCERQEGVRYKHPSEPEQVKALMMQHFDVVNTGLLGEFYITANCEKKIFVNDLSYFDESRDIANSLEEL